MCTPVCLVPINAVLPYMCPVCVRLICVHACIRFQSKRFCLICVPYVYALYVCLICVPYVYTRVSGSNQSSSASLKTSWASTRTSASCTLAVRTSSIFLTPRYLREHILWQENTFYGKRTYSMAREHILLYSASCTLVVRTLRIFLTPRYVHIRHTYKAYI